MKKNINIAAIYFFTIMFLELAFKIFIFGIANLFSLKLLYMLIFAIILSSIFTIISKSFSEKVNRILSYVFIIVTTVWFGVHLVFKCIFNTFFSVSLFKISDQAVTFIDEAVLEVIKNIPKIIVILIPLILVIIFKKHISYKKIHKKYYLNYLISLILAVCSLLILVNCDKESNILFYNVDNNALNIEHFGVSASTYLDFKRCFIPVKEDININIDDYRPRDNNDDEVKYKYNELDIDFNSLIESENNNTIKNMHQFFNNEMPTLQNEYSGIFKDKNLILVMAESLNNIAVSEKYTPTLYRLSHEGYEFTNFYTPINLSTIGGEFQELTGLFANLSMLSNYWRKGNNYFPFGIASMYKNVGYTTYAYHANYGTFQDRNKYLASLGFENFKYRGNGLEKIMNCNTWPQSDKDMAEVTYEDFINDEKFFTYYVSVSGHMPWSWSGNNMSYRNKDIVSDMNVGDEAKAYVAANIELDKMLELLINKLSEANKLDDTVIVVVPDHYPYSMNIDSINELSDYERDEKFEVNHSTLIIWNNQIEHQVIDKAITQLDVLPTIYNLFGLEYDSRLIMGKDLFSDSEGLVYFNDRSWLTDKGRYNAASKKFTPKENVEVDDEYINRINSIVANRINMSKLIIEHNYYKKVLGEE